MSPLKPSLLMMSQLSEVPVVRDRLFFEAVTDDTSVLTVVSLCAYLGNLTAACRMTPVGRPRILHMDLPGGHGLGIAAMLNWTESGVGIYTWQKYRFFTVDVYTCKTFSKDAVVDLTVSHFRPVKYRKASTILWEGKDSEDSWWYPTEQSDNRLGWQT